VALPSVEIDNLDLVRAIGRPDRTYAKLVVDAVARLSGAILLSRLQPVAWRNANIVQRMRKFELLQLAPCHHFESDESAHPQPIEQALGVCAPERLDGYAG